MSSLLLLGDIAPVGLTDFTWESGQTEGALTLANLETPLCEAGPCQPPKAGPVLNASQRILSSIRAPFPHLVCSLANNHSMDHGPTGLEDTIAACTAHGIRHVGAGHDIIEAQQALRMDFEGLRISVLAATDRQFGGATPTTSGVAEIGPDLFARIRTERLVADRVILSIHGGAETSPWPSPGWQALLRACVNAGADYVHGHHAHVPQGYERHGNGWIVYSPGNSVANPLLWKKPPGACLSWRFRFDMQNTRAEPEIEMWELRTGAAANQAHARKVALDLDRLNACNRPLASPSLLSGLWQIYALHLWSSFYEERLEQSPATLRFRKSLRPFKRFVHDFLYPQDRIERDRDRHLFDYHLFACEQHREAITTALGLRSGILADARSEESRALAAAWMTP